MAAKRESKKSPFVHYSFTKGNYVTKVSQASKHSHTVFECTNYKKKAKTCQIKDIFSTNPKETKALLRNVIPQTVVYYHKDCLKHKPLIETGSPHPEVPDRIELPMKFLREYGLLSKAVVATPHEAKIEELLLTHSKSHIDKISGTVDKAMQFVDIIDNSTLLQNDHQFDEIENDYKTPVKKEKMHAMDLMQSEWSQNHNHNHNYNQNHNHNSNHNQETDDDVDMLPDNEGLIYFSS